jgi:hypothetical protein
MIYATDKEILTEGKVFDLLERYVKLRHRKFGNIVFPAIRRVFPSMLANEIVSVQPMTAPTGLLFYLDHSYSTSGSK